MIKIAGLINTSFNPDCPACKKQAAQQPGVMHTTSQWNRWHKVTTDKAIEPLVKK